MKIVSIELVHIFIFYCHSFSSMCSITSEQHSDDQVSTIASLLLYRSAVMAVSRLPR